jgi:hypothetical protein
MKHYKDDQGNVYAYEADGSQDHLIKPELIPIENSEVQSLVEAQQQAMFDAEDYYRKRLYSYPEIGEFLDAWVKGDEQALEEYKQKCLEVKAKYPKPPGF